MATMIESGSVPLSIEGVAKISQSLASDLQKLVLRTEGFTVDDYFTLDGNYQVEYVDGLLQVLPMPESIHQTLIFWFLSLFDRKLPSIDPQARVRFAVFKVMLDARRYREPDVCVMLGKNAHRRHKRYWDGCDLAIEIISESNARHDWETKRLDYAAAGVPEYWVVDPAARTLTQFLLPSGSDRYPDGETFVGGMTVRSRVIDGLTVDVAAMFAEAEAQAD